MNKLLSLLIYLLMQLLQRRTAAQTCSNNPNVTYPAPVAASGWEYRLIANGLTRPRGIAFDADGGLLVVQSGVGLTHLTLDDGGGTCLAVMSNTTLIADPNLNHGLALSGDGKTVYVSSAESVFAFAYDSQAVSVDLSSNVTLVTNMSNTDHTTRTLLVSKKQPGTLLVSRGSSSNEDNDAHDINSGHSQIRSYNIAQIGPGDPPYDFLDGNLIGWGLRNSVGVAEHPSTGGIWSVENSVDQLQRQGQDIHQNNPGEELNYHGVLGSSGNQGGNYGYPDCYTLWSMAGFPDLGDLQVGDQFADDDAPSNVTDASCNTDYVPPRIAFQAHSAPLDIKFTPNASEAFVTFHGSWNRNEATGYRIVSLAFDSNGQPTAPQNSTNAVTDIIANADVTNCPDQCFRPVGLAWDSADRLWFSSDATGEIFVLERTNASNGGGGNPGDGNPNDGNPNDGNPNDGNPNDGNPNDGNPNDGNPNDGNPNDGNPNDGNPGDGNGGDGNGGDGNGGGNGQNAAGGLISERHGTVVVAQAAVLAGLLLA